MGVFRGSVRAWGFSVLAGFDFQDGGYMVVQGRVEMGAIKKTLLPCC